MSNKLPESLILPSSGVRPAAPLFSPVVRCGELAAPTADLTRSRWQASRPDRERRGLATFRELIELAAPAQVPSLARPIRHTWKRWLCSCLTYLACQPALLQPELFAAPQAEPSRPAATAPAAQPTAPAAQPTAPAAGQTPVPSSPAAAKQVTDQAEKPADQAAAKPALPAPPGLVRLIRDKPLWLDIKNKQVIVDGEVCLREGQLEMFACPRQTKEHESVLSVDVPARFIHAALIAAGAKKGTPVQFDPEYKTATGTVIEITLQWQDAQGQLQQARAQDWVRKVDTKEALAYDWVFVGSGLHRDPDSGETFYYADAGEFICVSNFPTAMLDLPVPSSGKNADLLFEAFTERIPPQRTPVRIVLTPKPAKAMADPGNPDPSPANPDSTKPTAPTNPSSQPTDKPQEPATPQPAPAASPNAAAPPAAPAKPDTAE